MMAPPLSDSEGEWEALGASPYTPLQAGGTTRSVMVRRSLSPDVPRSHPVAWEPNNTITPPAPSVMVSHDLLGHHTVCNAQPARGTRALAMAELVGSLRSCQAC